MTDMTYIHYIKDPPDLKTLAFKLELPQIIYRILSEEARCNA